MRPQKVSVDVWTMLYSSCSYLALAFAAWIFLRLVQACFWFPSHLKRQIMTEKISLTNDKQQPISGEEENYYQDGDTSDQQLNNDELIGSDKKTD